MFLVYYIYITLEYTTIPIKQLQGVGTSYIRKMFAGTFISVKY
jgi:hypothetical protein